MLLSSKGLIRSESESDAWQGPRSHQQDLCELELVPQGDTLTPEAAWGQTGQVS